jgi:hypothetical protein
MRGDKVCYTLQFGFQQHLERSPYCETRGLGNATGSAIVQQHHTLRVIQSDGQNRKLAYT